MITAWFFFLILCIFGWLATNCASWWFCNHLFFLSFLSSCIIFFIIFKKEHPCSFVMNIENIEILDKAAILELVTLTRWWWCFWFVHSLIHSAMTRGKNISRAITWSWEFFYKDCYSRGSIERQKAKSFVKHFVKHISNLSRILRNSSQFFLCTPKFIDSVSYI